MLYFCDLMHSPLYQTDISQEFFNRIAAEQSHLKYELLAGMGRQQTYSDITSVTASGSKAVEHNWSVVLATDHIFNTKKRSQVRQQFD